MQLLMLNGPNLNLLGLREPEIYGRGRYVELVALVQSHCATLGIGIHCVQSNHEGVLVDTIQAAYGVYDGIIFNPAAYTHTSIAILDALKAVGLPTVEVHLSDLSTREAFRQQSYISSYCLATIAGHGFDGYVEAIHLLWDHLQEVLP